MPHTTRTGLAAVLIAVTVTVSACGSTLLPPDELAGAQGAQDGSGLTAPGFGSSGSGGEALGSDLGDPGTGGAGDPLAGGAVPGPDGLPLGPGDPAPGGSGGQAPSGTAPRGTAPAGTAPGTQPGGGVSSKPIVVGITYPDAGAIGAVFGVDGEADGSVGARRLVDYINKTGGIAGRKLEAVYYKADSAGDSSTLGQQACAAFTEDKKVDVVINTGVLGDVLPACLLNAGVSMFDPAAQATDGVDMKRLPNWFRPTAMRLDRLFGGLVAVSGQAGTLKRGDVLGVVTEDCPYGPRSLKDAVQPEAARLGVTVVVGTHKCVTNIVSDLGPVSNDVQREVLRFRSSGVTHVMSLSIVEAFVNAQFTNNARQQNYAPTYLVTGNANPYTNTRGDCIICINEEARPRTFGAGYQPYAEIGDSATFAHAEQRAAQERCAQADETLGSQPGQPPSAFGKDAFYGLCDTFFVLKAVLESNGGSFALRPMTTGYINALSGRKLVSARLVDGYHSATSSRIDGVGAIRPFKWDTGKSHFVYSGSATARP